MNLKMAIKVFYLKGDLHENYHKEDYLIVKYLKA